MEPHLERVEVEMPLVSNDEFAIDNETCRRQPLEPLDDLRKISAERLARFGAQIDLIAGLESEAAEAVPFGLVLPAAVLGREVGNELRLHRGSQDVEPEGRILRRLTFLFLTPTHFFPG